MDDLSGRLMTLEIMFMGQEDIIETLNTLVHQQQIKIDLLEKQLVQVVEKVENAAEQEVEEAPPPHY
ncbi:MAG TPA: SlyX family protein [Leucothrix mucor]|nr:SlyX family protein [Leucothrix mucor]